MKKRAKRLCSIKIDKDTKAKALFDFLYQRKNILPNVEAVKELRLNVENLYRADFFFLWLHFVDRTSIL